jgi:hypothetical protein
MRPSWSPFSLACPSPCKTSRKHLATSKLPCPSSVRICCKSSRCVSRWSRRGLSNANHFKFSWTSCRPNCKPRNLAKLRTAMQNRKLVPSRSRSSKLLRATIQLRTNLRSQMTSTNASSTTSSSSSRKKTMKVLSRGKTGLYLASTAASSLVSSATQLIFSRNGFRSR